MQPGLVHILWLGLDQTNYHESSRRGIGVKSLQLEAWFRIGNHFLHICSICEDLNFWWSYLLKEAHIVIDRDVLTCMANHDSDSYIFLCLNKFAFSVKIGYLVPAQLSIDLIS